MPDANIFRRVEWLWRQHHPFHGEHDDLQEQITVIRTTIEDGSVSGDDDAGAYIHLTRDETQSIAVGGSAISWTSGWIPPSGFAVPSFPTTDIVVEEAGYYTLVPAFDYDTYTGGGRVWVTRTRDDAEITVWPPTGTDIWTATYGREFRDGVTPAIPCDGGDVLRVYVDHDDASSQDLAWAACAVYLDDRAPRRPSYREVVLADGPIAYWRLNEGEGNSTAVDETGNGHDGVYDAGVVQGQPGLIADDPDRSALFDEDTADSVDVPIHADLKLLSSDFTLEAWVQVTEAMSTTRWVLVWVGDGSGPRWGIGTGTSGGSVLFTAARDVTDTVSTTAKFDIGTAYHLVATYDATSETLSLYVNAELENSGSSLGSITDGSTDVRIGRDTDVGGDYFVDEPAVWDRVLDEVEIAEHHRAGLGQF